MAEDRGLLDHFRPPLYPMRSWESLHALWAGSMVTSLNEALLPKFYFAEAQVHVGSRVEVDVGTFDQAWEEREELAAGGGGTALAVEHRVYVAPTPMATTPAVYPDSVETLIYAKEGGAILAAAVELISPGNKDRPASRQAFVAKCVSYLQQGVGLVIVDIVTDRLANLHNELTGFLGGNCPMPPDSALYACAYRPIRRENDEHHDVWMYPLAVGAPLPVVPLALRRGPTIPLDLNATYRDACHRSRLD